MNKSIYEEAKRDLISLTAKFVIPNVEETEYGCIYDRCHFYNILDEQEESYLKKVEKALAIAKKEHELLDLYKYLNENTNDFDLNFDTVDEIHNKISEIEEQIKEKEND